MFLPALVAKFLSLSAAAQAASGVGIAVVAFTGAGATGLLGNDVQTTLTSVVGAAGETPGDVTPEASPSAEETGSPSADETPAMETPPAETPAAETPAAAPVRTALEARTAGPTSGQNFGAWVHEAFPDGKADGRIVSQWARNKHVDLAKVAGLEDVEGVDSTTAATATPEVETETETEHATEATHGGGNSGHGGGNSGRGHN